MIGAEEAARFLASKPVSILPGVGQVFARTLETGGFRTVGDLASSDPDDLFRRYGIHGGRLAKLARGEDSRPVDPGEERKSISAETTFSADLSRLVDLEDRLWPLCDKVARQARASELMGAVVTLKLKRTDFRIFTRRRSLASPTQTARILFQRGTPTPEAGGQGSGLSTYWRWTFQPLRSRRHRRRFLFGRGGARPQKRKRG